MISKPALKSQFAPILWRKRLVFWCGAIAIGGVAAGFAVVADYVQRMFASLVAESRFLPLLLSPIVFALTVWLTQRFCPAASGSGIPQAIAARAVDDPAQHERLLGMKVMIGKILLTTLGFLGGASIGREGPTVQAGASIMRFGAALGLMTNTATQRALILAGAAAGVAAAFNTPLAGIVFAIEEMARAFENRDSNIILTAIVLAGAASISLLGNYSYFGYADALMSLTHDWLAIVVLGVLGGLLGSAFAKCLTEAGPYLKSWAAGIGFGNPVIFAALCGLAIAFLGLASGGETYGTGYAQANTLLHHGMSGNWIYAPAKFLATAISGFSGIPGGIFSPSLSIGAAIGGIVAPWFAYTTPMQGIILLAMTGYFAGVTQAPITAFVVVLEVTGRAASPVPLIAVAVIAAGVGRLLCPVSLYHALAKTFILPGPESAKTAEENDPAA